jgi:hypothetical protein
VTSREELNSGVLPGNLHADDWALLVLAVVSAGLLAYPLLSTVPPTAGLLIFSVDCVVCLIFAVEFLVRWRRHGWSWTFLKRRWYEPFALLPAAHPVVVAHHFVAAVLLLARLGRIADRAVGEQFFYRLVERFSEPIVHAIKKPITVAVLDEVVRVLETGNYPENLAKSLTENSDELRAIIREKISDDEQLAALRRVPFSGEIVQAVIDTAFRIVLQVLQDPRIDDFFSAVVRDNRIQIRQAVVLGLNDLPDPDTEALLPTRTQHAAAREYDRNHPYR